MAQDNLGFRFALILGLATIVIALTTWLERVTSEPIYRAQLPYYF
jgi:hypothetical protein